MVHDFEIYRLQRQVHQFADNYCRQHEPPPPITKDAIEPFWFAGLMTLAILATGFVAANFIG